MHRILLSPIEEQNLREEAVARGLGADDLAKSYILSGIQRSKLPKLPMILGYLGACLLTALLVLLGLHVFSLPVAVPSLSSEFLVPRLLHWAREFVFAVTPWPLTIVVGLWIVARSGSAFWLLLGLFGSLRKIKLFGVQLELNEQSKQKIKAAATEIDLAVSEYKKRFDKELDRLASLHQIDPEAGDAAG